VTDTIPTESDLFLSDSRKRWFSLPEKLRRWWWDETDYGRIEPSPELFAAIRDMLRVLTKREAP
jgi:hypothetical protein